MVDLEAFLREAIPPEAEDEHWLEHAAEGVDFIVRNGRSEEIILYTGVGQAYVHAVLAPLANVTPADGADLQRAHIGADNSWALEHVSGGGQPDRMYLSTPLDSPGCKSLVGGEQLVFRRSFAGVDRGLVRTELSQPLIQALDLYWMEEERAFCRLNEDGDVEPIVRIYDLSKRSGEAQDVLVTIDAHQLHRYMAVTEMALVVKFDFTRYRSGSFTGWHDPSRSEVNEPDLFHHGGVQSNSSFVNGVHIVRPALTKDMMIQKSRAHWSDAGKQYATFIAQDWKNERIAEVSCAPSALASYFESDSSLPFQTTPAFFKPDVLHRYKADPEKYQLDHRAIRSRAGWSLKTYDVNEAGQVHTYLCYLGNLPYNEQIYWKSFNEQPKAPISERAFETDFEGSFSSMPDPLVSLKYEVAKLDKSPPDYWQPRDGSLAEALHYPLTASSEEWATAILVLDQLVVEGFVQKALRLRLDAAGRGYDKQWGSLRLLQEVLVTTGYLEDEAKDQMEPLKHLHYLRSKVKGHAAATEKANLIKRAKADQGSLPAHFRWLVAGVQETFDRIVERL
ncbi:hypothetical protein [Sphingomonas sp. S-NIH.Pt15_0812]|uniref:hypothetical protein n=1 Tax=Sphingomonas sp. S-NIH.Pt15_0812 TaxID=1920129 RepID=UPI000F7ECDFF|nr:hypothetical protein [Sphingomonas sp. S-NIH.Pt15_0812]RSU53987.1 hypothetical protein BRX43_03135 [Sphingomonas sp. S-NIH.Pt15_0812]